MKKYLIPFGIGITTFIECCLMVLAGTAIWNSTINTSDRIWYFSGKEYNSAQMRQISIKLKKDAEDRNLQVFCFNPHAHFKGYSRLVIDHSRGTTITQESEERAVPPSYGPFPGMANQLACDAVLPGSDSPMTDYMRLLIEMPITDLGLSWLDNGESGS